MCPMVVVVQYLHMHACYVRSCSTQLHARLLQQARQGMRTQSDACIQSHLLCCHAWPTAGLCLSCVTRG